MKKSKKNKISISGKYSFVCYCFIIGFIFTMSLFFSIIDQRYNIINWPCEYENIIGIVLQLITAITAMIVSIIGISISLQNEKVFGIKLTTLYALRKRKHYSVLQIIIISISFCALNTAFYMLDLKVAVIGTSITILLFILQVVYLEVPIMVKTENSVKQILKENFIDCYICESETPKPIKDAVRYLLYSDTLKSTFEFLEVDSEQEYNKYTLIKLLEFQQDLAFDLKTQYDDHEKIIIGSSLLENVFDVLLRHIAFSEPVYSKVIENKHLLIRVLFQIQKLPEIQNQFSEKVGSLIVLLRSSRNISLDPDLIADVIIILSAWTIKEGDTIVINALRRRFSNYKYILEKSSYALDVFALLSLYFYYLSCSDPDVPPKIKQKIKEWIVEGDIIEKETKITSWKNLFSQAAINFQVNYDRFSTLAMRNASILEYYLYGTGMKWIIFEPSYIAQWYLTNWLNCSQTNTYNYSNLIKKYPYLETDLKKLGNNCFNEDQTFVPTNEMNQIVDFYSDNKKHFIYFKIKEQGNHDFFKFINELKYAELKNYADQAANLDQGNLVSKIINKIRTVLNNEWGLYSQQTIHNEERYCSVLFEKTPEDINFEEFTIDYCVGIVLEELKKAIKKTMVYNDNQFNNNIQNILSNNPQYVTQGVKNTLPYFIKSKSLKQKFNNFCNHCNEIQSNLLGDMTIILTDNDFRFNYEILKVEFQELSEKEITDEVEKHQRADGQFIFNGVFMPREKIIEIVKAKYTVLSIVIKYQVFSSNKNIFKLVPYSNN